MPGFSRSATSEDPGHGQAKDQSRERRGEIPGGGPDPQANPARPALEDGTLGHERRHRNDTGTGGTARAARPALEDGTGNPDRGHRNDTGAGGTARAARPAFEDGTGSRWP